MIIYLVEDDPLQVDWVCNLVNNEFGDRIEVVIITSEKQFRDEFESGRIFERKPACIVMDVMLAWTEAGPEQTPKPKEIGSFQNAGLRCIELLHTDARTKDIPVLLYTVLDKNNLKVPPGTLYLRKDQPDIRLLSTIRELTRLN